MIYLRAAKKIYPKHRQAAGEEEAYNSSVLQQGWTLLIESSNGTHFNKGLEQTTLTARIYAANGVDYTKDLAALTPFWQINDSEWRGSGWTTDLHKSDIPAGQVITTISCTIKLIDVLKIVSSIPLSADQIHLNEDIKGELKIYNPYSVVDLVPISSDITRELLANEDFLSSVKGKDGKSVSVEDLGISWRDNQLILGGVVSPNLKGERGEDAVPIRPNEYKSGGTIKLYQNDNFGCSLTELGGGRIRLQITHPGVAHNGKTCASFYTHPTFTGGGQKNTICSFRVAESSKPITVTNHPRHHRRADGLYWFEGHQYERFTGFELYWNAQNAVVGDYAILEDFKLEIVPNGEALIPSTYIPHADEMRGVQLSELVSNAEFMQHTAQMVSEVGRFVSETALNSALADKVSSSQLIQELSKKQPIGDYVVSSYFSSELSKKQPVGDYATNTVVGSVATRAIRPVEAIVVGASTSNPFSSILGDPNGNPRVCSLNVVEGTDIYLPPAQDCAVGTKIYLRGSAMTCPVNPYHHNTTIRPIRIFSNTRDVYSAGRYYTNNTLLETFTNAEWRVDLECIVAGCGLKGWLWTNSVESKNLLELSSSITTAIQSIAETRQDLSNLKNNVLKKGEGLQLGFFNLVNHNSGTYNVKATDYHIVARRTSNGDTYPYIRVSESLPIGHEFIVDIPFNDCRVRFVLPSGGSTWGNGGTEWQSGYRYHVTKSHTNEWGVIKTAYAQ